jgi:16S rRNA (cytidine1402-2'-O)-methyltransferase
MGDREIVLARELTKKFEEIRRDKVSNIITHFKETKPKGEFVVII